jgi:hypothetical protein
LEKELSHGIRYTEKIIIGMVTFGALRHLGVNDRGLLNAGKILGIIEIAEQIESLKSKKISAYSYDIAADINELLLTKMIPGTKKVVQDYFVNNKRLWGWISSALHWTKDGLSFNRDVLIEIPRSDFKKFGMDKDEFVQYVNSFWFSAENPQDSYAWISDVMNSEYSIRFFFNLKSI